MLTFYPKAINVVECWEFRALMLLLQSKLTEAMIPHHTKLCELIIVAWQCYFKVLREELQVPLL
jgi:hypothetical protein